MNDIKKCPKCKAEMQTREFGWVCPKCNKTLTKARTWKKMDCFECRGLCCKVPQFREIYFPWELEAMEGRRSILQTHGKYVEIRTL